MLRIAQAESPEQIALVRVLFEEYADQLGHDLGFQHFSEELESLPGAYAPPSGRLLLGWYGDELAGCVALRGHDSAICEMKRLYVRPDFRGMGFGRCLATAVIEAAREIGYERMRLDTLRTMTIPRELYRSLGFQSVAPYYDNPIPGATFFELRLR
jgi:putative acetyltransferase